MFKIQTWDAPKIVNAAKAKKTVLQRLSWLLFGIISITAAAQAEVNDPTKPLYVATPNQAVGATESREGGIKLTSILISDDRKIAIINGQSLQESDTIKGFGAVIKKIEADAVTLQQNGKMWRVTLNNTAIRK